MKKLCLIVIALFAFAALVSCATTKSGETIQRARATVAAYEAGKSLSIVWIDEPVSAQDTSDYKATPAGPKTIKLDLTPQTEVKGDIKPNSRVLIRYVQYGKGDPSLVKVISVERLWD